MVDWDERTVGKMFIYIGLKVTITARNNFHLQLEFNLFVQFSFHQFSVVNTLNLLIN